MKPIKNHKFYYKNVSVQKKYQRENVETLYSSLKGYMSLESWITYFYERKKTISKG